MSDEPACEKGAAMSYRDIEPIPPEPGQLVRQEQLGDFNWTLVWRQRGVMWATDLREADLPGTGGSVWLTDWQCARRVDLELDPAPVRIASPRCAGVHLPLTGQPMGVVLFSGVTWLSPAGELLFAPFAPSPADLTVDWEASTSAHLWFLDLDEDEVSEALRATPWSCSTPV